MHLFHVHNVIYLFHSVESASMVASCLEEGFIASKHRRPLSAAVPAYKFVVHSEINLSLSSSSACSELSLRRSLSSSDQAVVPAANTEEPLAGSNAGPTFLVESTQHDIVETTPTISDYGRVGPSRPPPLTFASGEEYVEPSSSTAPHSVVLQALSTFYRPEHCQNGISRALSNADEHNLSSGEEKVSPPVYYPRCLGVSGPVVGYDQRINSSENGCRPPIAHDCSPISLSTASSPPDNTENTSFTQSGSEGDRAAHSSALIFESGVYPCAVMDAPIRTSVSSPSPSPAVSVG